VAKNKIIDSLFEFIDKSPTPFHAVQSTIDTLKKKGAVQIHEQNNWTLKNNSIYFVTRNASSIAVFKTPQNLKKSFYYHIIAAHTDSPCLKLKPKPLAGKANYNQWGVEVYGGVLYNSWLDRDLGVSGRISFKTTSGVQSKSISLITKKLRIPQLAIHLDRKVNEDGLKLNPQNHLNPILSITKQSSKILKANLFKSVSLKGLHNKDILAFDLFLHDTLASSYGGLGDEFIYAPRLDNLAMCHAALNAFIAVKKTTSIPVIFFFDNEEVGSESSHGAGSSFLPSVLERIQLAIGHSRESFMASLQKSFLISADMAHALHPNYSDRHDGDHMPLIGGGPVIKSNTKLRYATNSETSARFIELCQKVKVPYQEFVNRSDLACGTTIGPIVSSLSGIPTVDVGSPQLSMHSAREMAGSEDHGMMIKVFGEFFRN